MKKNPLAGWTGAAASGVLLVTAAHAGASDLGQPAQPARTLRYESAFKDYKPWQDTQRADWRGVNDALKDAPKDGAHGGHGAAAPGGAGSAAAGRPPASAARAAAPASALPTASHSGHGRHGGPK